MGWANMNFYNFLQVFFFSRNYKYFDTSSTNNLTTLEVKTFCSNAQYSKIDVTVPNFCNEVCFKPCLNRVRLKTITRNSKEKNEQNVIHHHKTFATCNIIC